MEHELGNPILWLEQACYEQASHGSTVLWCNPQQHMSTTHLAKRSNTSMSYGVGHPARADTTITTLPVLIFQCNDRTWAWAWDRFHVFVNGARQKSNAWMIALPSLSMEFPFMMLSWCIICNWSRLSLFVQACHMTIPKNAHELDVPPGSLQWGWRT